MSSALSSSSSILRMTVGLLWASYAATAAAEAVSSRPWVTKERARAEREVSSREGESSVSVEKANICRFFPLYKMLQNVIFSLSCAS